MAVLNIRSRYFSQRPVEPVLDKAQGARVILLGLIPDIRPRGEELLEKGA